MRSAIALLAVLAAGCTTESGSGDARAPISSPPVPEAFTAVTITFVGDSAAPVRGTDGRWHLLYELLLTNTRPVPATLERIEVLDGIDPARVLGTLEGESLANAMRQLATMPAEDLVLDPNEAALVFVALAFDDAAALPARIIHRFSGTGADNPGSPAPAPIRYLAAQWDVAILTPPAIGPPLAGEGWVAANGCCSSLGAHRGAVMPVSGRLWDAQRFAIDWMKIGPDGRLLGDGDPADPATWNAYGAPVLAVADGTVIEVLDGLDDQVPGALPDPTTITLETVDGNHVILDLGNGVFAFYAHLQKGSVRVQPGERVARGQVLGALGNSGNTSAPHLHLHLMLRPSALAADGSPDVFDQFDLTGVIDAEQWYGTEAIDGAWTIVQTDPSGLHRNELPLDLRIVTFPTQIGP